MKTKKTIALIGTIVIFLFLFLNFSFVNAVYTATPLSQLQWENSYWIQDTQIVVSNSSARIASWANAQTESYLDLISHGQIGYDYAMKIIFDFNVTSGIGVTNPDCLLVIGQGQPSGAGLYLVNTTSSGVNCSLTFNSGTTSTGNINLQFYTRYTVNMIYTYNITESKRYMNITIFNGGAFIGTLESSFESASSYPFVNNMYLYMGSASGLAETIYGATIYRNLYSVYQQTQTTIYYYSISPTPSYTVYNYVTSAHINQSQNYVYSGTAISVLVPYGTIYYNVYTTPIISGSLNNNTIRNTITSNLGLIGSESLTLNTSGAIPLNGGPFNFNILLNYGYNSVCKYEGYKINGTIPSTGENFTSYIIIEANEPSSNTIITVYLNGGTTVNMLLTQISFNQIAYNTQYNASGFIYLNGVPYISNNSVIIYSTSISIDQIVVKNLPFNNQLNLTAINGQFTFLITPQIYNVLPSYQGIRIYQPTLGISTTYWIEYIGLGTTIFPTPYPTSSSSIVLNPSGSTLDLTQFAVMFFLLFMPPLLLAGMCFELKQKTSLDVSPVIGFFLGLCVMVPIGYLTPYNGQPLVPLWMLFIFVAGLIVAGVLIFKNMFHGSVTS